MGHRGWGWEPRSGQELSLGRIYLFIQQIFAEGLLCTGHPPRSGDRGPGGKEEEGGML